MKEASLKRLRTIVSNYKTFWKRQNYGDSKKMSDGQDLGGGGMNRQSTEDFSGSEAIWYDPVTVNTCHHMPVKTHRMQNAKSEP